MSSGDALLAIRTSGSMRLSAAIAGSSEGKTLSVTAINGRAMMSLQNKSLLQAVRTSAASRHPDPVRSQAFRQGSPDHCAAASHAQAGKTSGLTQLGGRLP